MASPDYHALDRLYSIESEERQERRGLETRASASIVAALSTVAFSANAVSDRLGNVGPWTIALLGGGALFIFTGVGLSTAALVGGSRTTRRIVSAFAMNLSTVSVGVAGMHLQLTLDPDLDRASADVEQAARTLRMRTEVATFPGAGRLLAELLAVSAGIRTLKASDTAHSTEHGEVLGPSHAAITPQAAPEPSPDSSLTAWPLREPADLEEAMRRAETSARRLREENNEAVVVLKLSSLAVALGVLILVAGVVLACAIADPVMTASTP
ncbi:MAG: hypothetical protein JWR63_4396 [Conexibacter sp.]|nr:hypothetical protein [Conexibacter sp.]